MPSNHELSIFMDQVAAEMNAEYGRIRQRAREDPGTAGDESEENWRNLFQDWLPGALQIVKKGRILGADGTISPQVDVLILSPSYPKKLREKKVYLAGGVVATFECKLTLRPEHLEKCIRTSKLIKEIATERRHDLTTPYRELYSPIVYGVLAHDADFGNNTIDKLDWLIGNSLSSYQHPADQIDVICVATLGSWERMSGIFLPPPAIHPSFWDSFQENYKCPPEGGIHTQYSRWEYYGETPTGAALRAMIGYVLERVARRLPAFQDFARYWALARDAEKMGNGKKSRMWSVTVLSDDLQHEFQTRGTEIARNKDFWSEWRHSF